MTQQRPDTRPKRPAAQPLDSQRLTDLAYAYAARYAVTEGRLRRYLAAKVREKGWSGAGEPAEQAEALIRRLVEMGVVNDAIVARSTVDMSRRKGLAGPRIRSALAARQVRQEVAAAALAASMDGEEDPAAAAVRDAERFAQRKRLGPWRTVALTPERQKKEIAALLRAGHSPDVARQLVTRARP